MLTPNYEYIADLREKKKYAIDNNNNNNHNFRDR